MQKVIKREKVKRLFYFNKKFGKEVGTRLMSVCFGEIF